MKTTRISKPSVAAALLALGSISAIAVPTAITISPVAGCDPAPPMPPVMEELGLAPGFLPGDEIAAGWGGGANPPCPMSVMGERVKIMNNTTGYFKNVWYVADTLTTISNPDRVTINGEPAFRIDNIGLNRPLVMESMTPDGIFEPTETWEFVIGDYANGAGLTPDQFIVPDVPFAFPGVDSGNIIAEPMCPQPTVVAQRGQWAPGFPSPTVYANSLRSVIGDTMMAAWVGRTAGGGVTPADDEGLWQEIGPVFNLAREGMAIPPNPGIPGRYGSLVTADFQVNDSHWLAMRAPVTSILPGDAGIFYHNGSTVMTVAARIGNPSPVPGVRYRDVSRPTLSDTGLISFTGRLRLGGPVTAANDTLLVQHDGNTFTDTIVVREGNPAVGGGLYGDLNPTNNMTRPTHAAAGQIGFIAPLTGVPVVNNAAVYVAAPGGGGITQLARRGLAVPSVPGHFWEAFAEIGMASNSGGLCTVRGKIRAPGLVRESIHVFTGGIDNMIALQGQPAVGMPAGTLYGQMECALIPEISTAANWEVTWSTRLNTGRRAIYVTDSTATTVLLAAEGNPAPGTTFNFATLSLPSPRNTSATRTIFRGTLAGAPVAANTGIWQGDRITPTALLFLEGNPVIAIPGLFQDFALSGATTGIFGRGRAAADCLATATIRVSGPATEAIFKF